MIRLALASSALFLLHLTGCPIDNDDDDDSTETITGYGDVIFTVHESLPTAEVTLIPTDENNETLNCMTPCELQEIPFGEYTATAELDGALFISVTMNILIGGDYTHMFSGGWTHDGVYEYFYDEAGTDSTDISLAVNTAVHENIVRMSIEEVGNFQVEGNTMTGITNSSVVATTLVPGEKFRLDAMDGTYYVIRQ